MSRRLPDRRGWMRRLADKATPSREEVLESRWLKPFGKRVRSSELWRFTRRSVPAGVFAGLFIGIFLLIPGLQIVGAALMCIPLRGNIPIAAAMTFLSNPATTPLILLASIAVGNQLGFHADLASFERLYESGAGLSQWGQWLLSDAAPSLLTGLLLISLVFALVGYALSILVWRWWVHRKWRRRTRPDLFHPPSQAKGDLHA